uniref:hypothetical protein n=1 Tax=Bacillus subtilis TaxID=1423 RepID=UPI0025516A52|nr:hypothetical protein [Bacillus subtilis]
MSRAFYFSRNCVVLLSPLSRIESFLIVWERMFWYLLFEVIGVKELPKELLEELERTTFLLNEVIEIYEQHEGEPEEKPAITCPSCHKESTNYVCDWYGNRHVHFHCECGCRVHQ